MPKIITTIYLETPMIKHIRQKSRNTSKYISDLIKADMKKHSLKEPILSEQMSNYEEGILQAKSKEDLKDETYWHAIEHWNKTIKNEVGRKAKAQDYPNVVPLQQTADNLGIDLVELLKDIDEYKK